MQPAQRTVPCIDGHVVGSGVGLSFAATRWNHTPYASAIIRQQVAGRSEYRTFEQNTFGGRGETAHSNPVKVRQRPLRWHMSRLPPNAKPVIRL